MADSAAPARNAESTIAACLLLRTAVYTIGNSIALSPKRKADSSAALGLSAQNELTAHSATKPSSAYEANGWAEKKSFSRAESVVIVAIQLIASRRPATLEKDTAAPPNGSTSRNDTNTNSASPTARSESTISTN